MNKTITFFASLLLAACGQNMATDKVVETESAAHELPVFNTYSEEQMAVLAAFDMAEFDTPNITTVPLRDGLAVIFGIGGNVLVSVGDDGVIMVDNQFPEIHEALLHEIKKLGGEKVDYVINTHWHFDHAEGNRAFGPLGAEIIAHENSATYMAGDHNVNLVELQYPQQAYPPDARPDTTYSDTLELSLNGQVIGLYNFGPAHTTGDTLVYFKTANVVHMGDVGDFSPTPFIDVDNGGDIDGVIKSVRAILELIDDETIVVPGHGDIGDKQRLTEFVELLVTVRKQIAMFKADGRTVEEVQVAYTEGALADTVDALLIDRAYHSIE